MVASYPHGLLISTQMCNPACHVHPPVAPLFPARTADLVWSQLLLRRLTDCAFAVAVVSAVSIITITISVATISSASRISNTSCTCVVCCRVSLEWATLHTSGCKAPTEGEEQQRNSNLL